MWAYPNSGTFTGLRSAGLLALLLIFFQVSGQSWSREQFTSESGLLQNRVHGMEMDPWGGLLIGTEGGLVRFDGEHFRQIGIPAPEGMRPARVLEIVAVPDGAFVIRDAGSRQYLFKDNVLTPITSDAPARKPLSRFSGEGVSADLVIRSMDPDSLLAGKSDWAYSVRFIPLGGDRWCLRSDHEMLVYSDSVLVDRFPVPSGRWSHLVRFGKWPFVLDSVGRGYRVEVDRRRTVPVTMLGFPSPEMKQGQLMWRMFWSGIGNKVGLVAGDSLYDVTASAKGDTLFARRLEIELPKDCKTGGVTWLEDGNVLAVGTDTKGLFIYRRNTMRTLLCEVTLDGVNNAYTAQAPYGSNGVLTSTRGSARVFTAAGCDPVPPPMRGFDEVAIALDPEQRYWYGRDDSLFMFDRVTGEEHLVRAGFRPLCFMEENGAMWVGSAKGIHRVHGDSVVLQLPLNEHDLSFRPTAICRAPNGEFWMATCSGVYRSSAQGGWEAVPGLAGVCARALAVVERNVYVGTYGSGAYLYKEGKVLHLPEDHQGFMSHVHAFMPDQEGFMWLSTNQGLFRMRLSDIEAWSNDTTQRIYQAYYGKRSGILNPEFNGGCDPAFVRTADGWASFPTMDGLVWFRPEAIPDAYPMNEVLVEHVEVDGVSRSLTGPTDIPWDHHEVVVRFSLAYWGDQENARLEYRLEGANGGQWIPLRTGQRELRFSTLPSGTPELRIRKVGSDARGEPDALTYRFVVPAPYYRTFWFIALCAIGGVLVFWSALRFNAARLRRKNLQLEKKVRERTGELLEANAVLRRSLEMKEMLVSIISHDIVTPLRFIARVANGVARNTDDRTRMQETLRDLARSSDKLHANAQDLLHWIKRQDGRIDLRPRNVAVNPMVDEVLDMERERAMEKGVLLVNEVGVDDVVRTDRNVLSIVLHNLVANAVTHTDTGTVTLTGRGGRKEYVIMVKDSGPGMPEAAWRHAKRVQHKGALGAMNEEGERDVQGLGLLIVADLLQLLGGRFEVVEHSGIGTEIQVTIPQDVLHEKSPSTGNGTPPIERPRVV
ncbi:MAG TPA: ATP-binding protein [Flavobacteriales bacterium]